MLIDPTTLHLSDESLRLHLDIICHKNPQAGWPPFYQFSMHHLGELAGVIHLRVGEHPELTGHLGHIGYEVFPSHQGHALAQRSTQLLLPLAKLNALDEVWITCNPDNYASIRTCEKLGAEYMGIVPVPQNCPMYLRGERFKRRYRLSL